MSQSHDFGTPSESSWAQNSSQNLPSETNKFHFSSLWWCLVAHPCFHETIMITVPLGHGGFQKVICSKVGSFLVFVSEFLCALFYVRFHLLLFFYQIWITPNRWALRLLRTSPHIKNKRYFLILVLCDYVFCFFILLLISWYPLPPPWARLVPFWVDSDATFVRLLIWNTLFGPMLANNLFFIYR